MSSQHNTSSSANGPHLPASANGLRLPASAKPYIAPMISPQDLPVDYAGFIAVVFGVAGVMFRSLWPLFGAYLPTIFVGVWSTDGNRQLKADTPFFLCYKKLLMSFKYVTIWMSYASQRQTCTNNVHCKLNSCCARRKSLVHQKVGGGRERCLMNNPYINFMAHKNRRLAKLNKEQ